MDEAIPAGNELLGACVTTLKPGADRLAAGSPSGAGPRAGACDVGAVANVASPLPPDERRGTQGKQDEILIGTHEPLCGRKSSCSAAPTIQANHAKQ